MNKKEIEQRVDIFIENSQDESENWKETFLCRECLLREFERYVIKRDGNLLTLKKCECRK